MDMEDELQHELLEVDKGFYTKKITSSNYGLKFPIPIEIVCALKLQVGDTCYFCKYSEGYYRLLLSLQNLLNGLYLHL